MVSCWNGINPVTLWRNPLLTSRSLIRELVRCFFTMKMDLWAESEFPTSPNSHSQCLYFAAD